MYRARMWFRIGAFLVTIAALDPATAHAGGA
jgi:hypothetical protein